MAFPPLSTLLGEIIDTILSLIRDSCFPAWPQTFNLNHPNLTIPLPCHICLLPCLLNNTKQKPDFLCPRWPNTYSLYLLTWTPCIARILNTGG